MPKRRVAPPREWVSIEDPRETRTWHLDLTFLASSWHCIFGQGCQGVLPDRAPDRHLGCCSHGAYFTDKADRERIVRLAEELDDSEWQLAAAGRRQGVGAKVGKTADGSTEWRTRLVDDACIFLNRVGFPAGPGCALHLHALRTGRHFSETKPEVCWQVPLRRVDEEQADGSIRSTVTEFDRAAWGEGGREFGWWCTEEPAAFGAAEPVYVSMAVELRAMIGAKVYAQLAAHLDARRAGEGELRPHPAERRIVLQRARDGAAIA